MRVFDFDSLPKFGFNILWFKKLASYKLLITPYRAFVISRLCPFINMFLIHWTRDYCTQLILSKDLRLARKALDISERCSKHDSEESNTNACSCSGAIWYSQDRVEKGIKRLNDGNWLITWFWWYICSSSKSAYCYLKLY